MFHSSPSFETLPADLNRRDRVETLPYFPDQDKSKFEPITPSDFLDNYLIAQSRKLTPVQAASKNFGDLPIIGPMIRAIEDYEDAANYRNAPPEYRKLLKLE